MKAVPYRARRTAARVEAAGHHIGNLVAVILRNEGGDFHAAGSFSDHLFGLKDEAKRRILSENGETHPGMAVREFLKTAERLGFETVGGFSEHGRRHMVLGRRSDATVIALGIADGAVRTAELAFMYRSITDGFAAARDFVSTCCEALETRLALMETAGQTRLSAWCVAADDVADRPPDGRRGLFFIPAPRERTRRATDAFLGRMKRGTSWLDPEWESILDVKDTRSFEEAVRLTEQGGLTGGIGAP